MEAGEATGPLSPQEEVCMHLTNYAINKHNENFVRDDTVGSKRYSLLGFLPLSLSPAVSAARETGALGRLMAQEKSTFRPWSCAAPAPPW